MKHRAPKHRADRPVDRDWTEAECSGIDLPFAGHSRTCPRHFPAEYADMHARHATDSLGPALGSVPTRWLP